MVGPAPCSPARPVEGSARAAAVHPTGPAWFGTGRRWARSEALRIRLAAPPVDGKANDALIDFPAEAFRMPARNVTLMAGHASRSKCMRVDAPARRPDQGWG
ncbi:MAG: DUF167 domain-containing protein [Flavobacteriales bacterium]|nr:DUF167 domain-containing protein [Flavobacteriales bacterium]